MAHMSRIATVIDGGVTDREMFEGTLVSKAPNTGATERADLPKLTPATAGQVKNVYVLIACPDDFVRPTDARWYTAPTKRTVNWNTGYGAPVHTYTYYDVGMSALWNPMLPSGCLAQACGAHGSYALASGTWNDSANIRAKGALVKVGTGSKLEYTTDASNAIGQVDEYDTVNGVLIFSMY